MALRISVVGLLAALATTFAGSQPARADRAELSRVMRRLLRQYQGCILERYETPQTRNLRPRDGSRCLAGNACTLGSRRRAWSELNNAARRGIDTNFSDKLKRAILADCMQCGKHRKWHTKHVHCTMDCGGNNGIFKGPCFEGCKAGVDITAWFRKIGRDIAQALGAVKPVEAADEIGGSTIAKNNRTVEHPRAERCEPLRESRDGRRLYLSSGTAYYLPPAQMLDWTPTSIRGFKITLNGPLKALAIGAAAGVGALAGLLGPLAAAGGGLAAGGVTGLAMHGIPSQLIGFPPGRAPTRGQYNRPVGSNLGANEGRLRSDLRAFAKRADPVASLCEAAERFARRDPANGKAFADLSVTGRRSFARFRRVRPQVATLRRCLRSRPGTRRLSASARQRAARQALDRAYQVATVLRAGGWPGRCNREREALGWIAVSGEDDQPHRPVNVPSAEYPQYDIGVPVRGRRGTVTVHTRYTIIHPSTKARAPSCRSRGHRLAADPRPVLPKGTKVILYVHGMDSRLEEALDLANALHRKHGAGWTVISMDLPTSGYGENLDHQRRVSPISDVGEAKFRYQGAADLQLTDLQVFNARGRHTVPLVDFIEDFIVAFMGRLDRLVHVKRHPITVVGGSLGGNMSLRLGQRRGVDWIKSVVPWSPAAIWPSYADGANPGNHLGVAMPWMWSGGDRRFVAEKPESRRYFFYKGFDWTAGVLNLKPQPQEWYRDGWGPSTIRGKDCKKSHIIGARLDRQETYDRNYRLWHWRLGAEQIVFSHQGPPGAREPRYMKTYKRTLLICGYQDTGAKLCEHARAVARKMTRTPGKALFVKNTGHSIHNERPAWLAREITEFLGSPRSSRPARRRPRRSLLPALRRGLSLLARFRIGVNQDHAGGDYRSFRSDRRSYVSCLKTCQRDRRCRAFTWQRSSGMCWLKSRVLRSVRKRGYTTGAKR